jgi:prepilin-type N-terminal cleavage/methylation domain-containing protein
MLNKTKKISNKGYTLIEILVGISVFLILIAISVNFFVSSLEMQQKALLSQRMLDNISYTIEYMSRALRMAQKDKVGSCVGVNNNYATTTTGIGGIKFLNYRGECWEFYRSATSTANKVRNLVFANGAATSTLTSEFLDVVSFKIVPSGWNSGDTLQPRVTLFLDVKMMKGNKPELQPTIKIQTTISQRNLDI